ncbi:hypothetical protein CDD82_3658 [Ophiocordyceps australis]|uniref:Uncharacterized protein n=1 Tax=Ophiocordyceps australis TaxID=1399860 RepID=A0A2C5YGC9_9HYPO|nr:hypothetical protein CDD82_3658 [Ophiocordyceps australis]
MAGIGPRDRIDFRSLQGSMTNASLSTGCWATRQESFLGQSHARLAQGEQWDARLTALLGETGCVFQPCATSHQECFAMLPAPSLILRGPGDGAHDSLLSGIDVAPLALDSGQALPLLDGQREDCSVQKPRLRHYASCRLISLALAPAQQISRPSMTALATLGQYL